MPKVAQIGGGGSTRARNRGGGLRNPGIQPLLWKLISTYSQHLNLDPYAVAAVSRVEGGGRFGEVGDNGTSFGPFQLHVGGALPPGRDAAWANSPAGVLYAMQHMATVAAGLRGLPAVRNIVTRFERPAAPGPEVSNAWAGYRSFGASLPGPAADTQNAQYQPNFGPLMAAQRQAQAAMSAQFAKAQTTLLAQLKTQAAQSRQQALAQSAAQQLFQRHQAAQQAQMQLTGQPAAGLTTDPTTNLVEQSRQKVVDLRTQALRRAGLA